MKLSNSRALQLLFIVLSLFILLADTHTKATLVEQTSPLRRTAKEKAALVCVVSHGDPEEPQSNMDASRPPTDTEREGVMKMVRQIYRAHGTMPAALNSLKTTNLTATDLNGDGEFELIGSFVLESKTPDSIGTKTPSSSRTKSPN